MSVIDRPRVLIEDWLPIAELGVESRRERAAANALPPIYFLHVWWARRPLVASAAAIMGSLLPAWSSGLAHAHPGASELKTADSYRRWFLRICGILRDPIEAQRGIDHANELGIRLKGNVYGYPQAFKHILDDHDQGLIATLLEATWSTPIGMIDPTAGGGSIPFEAIRFGINATANELNPVAAAILRATLEIPSRWGAELTADIERLGRVLCDRLRDRLLPYFPLGDPSERVVSYLFARTIACPRTGKIVPLAPNWWISRGKPRVAVRLLTDGDSKREVPDFSIVTGALDFDPDRGTVSGGDAVSVWDGLTIDGEYIRQQATAGRLGHVLYAVATETPAGRSYRSPTLADLDGLRQAETELFRLQEEWAADDILPSERIPPGLKTAEPRRLGMHLWRDLFSPRQQLVHGMFVEEFRRLTVEVRSELAADRAEAVLAILSLAHAKALNYNAVLSSWNVNRERVRSVFDQHNFEPKWSYTEFDGARQLFQWAVGQVTKAYDQTSKLIGDRETLIVHGRTSGTPRVLLGNAAALSEVPDGSMTLVCIDPPYYANVMYAELSDFFYVWEKRTLGLIYPELFVEELTDKKNEAVANVARFEDQGRRKRELATADYRAKMTAIFAECDRVLDERGVMTVMFTHKEADAWDSLGTALMESGFTIETSWPVNTESEQSLHQAKKNSAASTIMLVCRKRGLHQSQRHPFFEDLEAEVRAAARDATLRFAAAGIGGVDLLLSTYGPALSVISARWPVYSSEADAATGRSRLLRPEEALDAAREEVVRLRRQRLVGSAAVLDPLTDFALLAWDTFKAAEFPFDEARRLALASGGLDVDELVRAKIVDKKSGTVVLRTPAQRVRKRGEDLPGVNPEAVAFPVALDALHTVMYVADVDGLPAARALLDRAGLMNDSRFLASLQGFVNAIPRAKSKGEWVRPEAGTLDRLCAVYFPGISLPKDMAEPHEQIDLPIAT